MHIFSVKNTSVLLGLRVVLYFQRNEVDLDGRETKSMGFLGYSRSDRFLMSSEEKLQELYFQVETNFKVVVLV